MDHVRHDCISSRGPANFDDHTNTIRRRISNIHSNIFQSFLFLFSEANGLLRFSILKLTIYVDCISYIQRGLGEWKGDKWDICVYETVLTGHQKSQSHIHIKRTRAPDYIYMYSVTDEWYSHLNWTMDMVSHCLSHHCIYMYFLSLLKDFYLTSSIDSAIQANCQSSQSTALILSVNVSDGLESLEIPYTQLSTSNTVKLVTLLCQVLYRLIVPIQSFHTWERCQIPHL